MDTLVAMFNGAPIKQTLGMTIHYNDEAQAIFDWPYNPSFDHAGQDTHGAVFATLLDNAGWFTAAACYDSVIVTVELTTRLLEPAKREDLQAIGTVIRTGRRLAIAQMQVESKSGRLVATGAGTFSLL